MIETKVLKSALQCYNVTMLHCYNVTMLQCYNVTMLQCYNVKMLLCYNVTMLQCYNVTVLDLADPDPCLCNQSGEACVPAEIFIVDIFRLENFQ